MDQQESWGLLDLNKLRKMAGHCANVSRNEYTPSLGCAPKNFRIGSAIQNNTGGSTKLD
jgi:hypothetical protein